MTDTSIKASIIIFRYIPVSDEKALLLELDKQGLKLTTKDDRVKESWDYPRYSEDLKSESIESIISNMKSAQSLKSSKLTKLIDFRIDADCSHFQFAHILMFEFDLEINYRNEAQDNKKLLLSQLNKATREIKEFTDYLTPQDKAPYRPVYWFVDEMEDKNKGLQGSLDDIYSANGNHCYKMERGFPSCSYIIYGLTPQLSEVKLADLGLVSVIVHDIERSVRGKIEDISNKIETHADEFDSSYKNYVELEPVRLGAFSSLINSMERTRTEIRKQRNELYDIRKQLIRKKGLVERVRQINGKSSKRTMYDFICDDASTLIEDELKLSQEIADSGLKNIEDRINTVFSQANVFRGQRLQELGYLLQSTAIGYTVFQVFEKLFKSAIDSTPANSIYLPFTNLPLNPFVGVGASLVLGLISSWLTYNLLKKQFGDKQIISIGDSQSSAK